MKNINKTAAVTALLATITISTVLWNTPAMAQAHPQDDPNSQTIMNPQGSTSSGFERSKNSNAVSPPVTYSASDNSRMGAGQRNPAMKNTSRDRDQSNEE